MQAHWQSLFSREDSSGNSEYKPFSGCLDWELAQWAMQEKISHRSFDHLLKILQVKERLNLSYSNSRSMLQQVDALPERCGKWYTKQFSFKDRPEEHFTVRHRDPIEAIRGLWGDSAFANDLGGTVAPVIIASDKTQLIQFSGNKAAYPVYMTIGNLPKSLRRKPKARACVLIAYLSLFHRSMAVVLQSLKAAGNPKGGGVEMVGGDGAVRRVYLILTAYVADYPEQCLVTCTKYGTSNELELPNPGEMQKQKWTYNIIKEALHALCMENDVAGGRYEPFWVEFPLVDIHCCITPDILHQLYQGVLKHLICISALSQVSGTERKHIIRILLSCLVGKIDPKGIIACRSLLSFIHLAQYPSHDEETLGYMRREPDNWHKHRSYFIKKGPREDFNIPKFHSLLHYVDAICWFGTTDNYNTEMFECLHIDFTKEGWRASNKCDHFPQMVKFLSRKEKIANLQILKVTLKRKKLKSRMIMKTPQMLGQIVLAKLPQEPKKSLSQISISHLFLNSFLPSSQQVSKSYALQSPLPFTTLDIWHHYKFIPTNMFDDESDGTRETIKAVPIYRDILIP
ncbi:hypothetical protein GGU11DRAFT_819093 [Lentinula aff. detonsa]|nr:hypothetical protein GGU11DRAFT_819093 [Lentinula aff. detonsa]